MRLKRIATLVGGTVAGLYVITCAALFFTQRGMVFPRPEPMAIPERLAKVIHIEGGQPTLAWYRVAPANAPTIVYFHGNGGQLAREEWLALECKQRGLGYFAVEYPGYGQAAGEPSEASVLGAAESAATWLETKGGVAKRDMVLLGQSLGTGPAVWLASKGYGRALVLITPYTAISDIGARQFPWLPVRLLMRDQFRASEWAPKVKVPTLAFHGTADEVIPFDIGKGLTELIPGAELVALQGVSHNDVWDQKGVLARVMTFAAGP